MFSAFKNIRGKSHNLANKSWLRAVNSLAKCQRCHILIPHCTNLHHVAGSSPSFHSLQILDSSLTLFSVPLWGEVQCWLCCTLEIPLLAKTGSCFLPTRFPPVQSLLSPVALGWVMHMESQVDRPCSPGHIPDSSLPRADSFSWERKLKFGFKAHTFFLLSKEVYLDLLKKTYFFWVSKKYLKDGLPRAPLCHEELVLPLPVKNVMGIDIRGFCYRKRFLYIFKL